MRWWAWIIWALLTLALIAFAAGLWAWTQRYALMEDLVVDTLAESGFDAELDIISVTRRQARVRNIRVKRGDETFLTIDDLRADYIWPDIRDGRLKGLEIDGATGRLSLGEDWQPSADWIQELLSGDGEGSRETAFPENGVKLTDGTLVLNSPLGEAKLYIDADIPAEDNFTAEITLAPSNLSYAGYAAEGAGFATVEKDGPVLKIIGRTQTATLSNSEISVSDADLQIDGKFNLDSRTYDGSVSLDGRNISSDLFASGPARIGWDGTVALLDEIQASGTWTINAVNARSPRPARAAEVAETLSLFPALSVVPVTEHYAPELRAVVLDFISAADISGQGRLDYGPKGFTLNPVGTFIVETSKNKLNLRANETEDFYKFTRIDNLITARMDASFQHPVRMSLKNIELNASSENGLQLKGIQSFSSDLATASDWQTKSEAGRDIRLGPLKTALQYEAAQMPRRLSIKTALDYDGDLPGGYVESLTLAGQLDVRLYDGRQALDFTPNPGSLVTLKSLETPTAWVGEDIAFTLEPTRNLFARTARKSVLAATLKMADFTLTQPATTVSSEQRLDLQTAAMTLNGTLLPDAVQEWSVDFTDVAYASETLPGPETTGSAAQAMLTARLSPDKPPQISVVSPAIFAQTPTVHLADIGINLRGTPDSYSVEHQGGTITVVGSDFADRAKNAGLASFPANGTMSASNGVYTGRAVLRVAKADNADVRIEYNYHDGTGTADIDIPSILFAPKGLQPQSLIPALSGKIARVDGEARAQLQVSFADGALTTSGGTVQLIDMSVGTAPGPITGLNTTMRFTSLFPLQTSGEQNLTLESFNPGFPLDNGTVRFNFVPEGVQVNAADWPIGNGSFSLDPFTWVYAAEENRVTMRVKNVDLGDFLNDVGNKKVQATGTVVGTFPIVVRGIDVLIEDGKVSVPDGGIIKYDPGPGAKTYTEAEAISVLRERRSNEYAALAKDALREFRYRELSAALDGPLNGDVEIGLVFDGSNEKVLNRQPFRFDISVRGELFNIARSFNSNAQVKSEILRQNGKLPQGTALAN